MKLRIYWLLLTLLLGSSHILLAEESEKINILHPYVYGFESGGDGWWLQHSDYWSLSQDKATNGSYSMKYSHASAITDGAKKAHGSNLPDYPIVVKSGTYQMTLKVWIANGTDLTAFNTTFKEPEWVNVKWTIENVEREKWVELTTNVTFPSDINGSSMLITMDQSYGGVGTFYIDEIAIWDDAPTVAAEIPYVSTVNTIGEGNISLNAGTYNVKAKVYVESGTTISKAYTFISKPWIALDWDLSSVQNDEWVELNQEVIIPEKVDQSIFKVQVNNNPLYGGGKGSFFIDDIVFEFISSDVAVIKTPSFEYHVFPNPAHDLLRIKSAERCTYMLCNISGAIFKASNVVSKDFTIYVSDLPSGVYILQLKSGNKRVVEKIKIK